MTPPGWIPVLLVLGCTPDQPEVPEQPEDLPVEPCNGKDDDRDGLVDEGNDVDGDGTPDCFDVEECDGLDNDGDGLIDEDFDADGDGLGDCLDVEECDDLDNDGDGEIDEDFPLGCDPCDGVDNDGDGEIDEDGVDTDEDGIADCVDVEECDGLDNDGDGQIDEDTDHDFDGVCDTFDTEVCDGWDNNGDGNRDEGFDDDGDGVPDCWIPEICDGIDNDGDGQVDEEFGSCGECGLPTEYTVCAWDVGQGDFLCSYGQPVELISTQSGMVLDVDMAGWQTVWVHAAVEATSGVVLTVANSPTCNGYGGDSGTSAHDNELQLDGGGSFRLYGSDLEPGVLIDEAVAFDPASDDLFVQICDGWVGYRSRALGTILEHVGPDLFQFDGNEIDFERPGGVNDRVLHLGIGRTVGDATRNGTGIHDVVVILGR